MQTILLNIIHPSGKLQTSVQAPVNYTVSQLLDFFKSQSFIPYGNYNLVAKGRVMFSTQCIGRSNLQPNEVLRIIHEPVRPTFDGGRGKGSLLLDSILQYKKEQQPTPPPKPEKKGFWARLFS